MGKTQCCEKVVGLRKGRWSREEDEVLSRYIQAYGHGSWMSLPYKAGLYLYTYICIYVCMYACIYVCMYVYKYVCMHAYVCEKLLRIIFTNDQCICCQNFIISLFY